MAQYGPNNVKIEIEATVGAGTLTDITQYVTTLAGLKVNGNLEDGTVFGSAWEAKVAPGVRSADDPSLEGFYDDTATTGPDAIFSDHEGEKRQFKVTIGGTKTWLGYTLIKDYEAVTAVKSKTKFKASLSWTGAITRA